jgi:lysozyme
MPRHAISPAGLALIQDYEGFRAEPAQLPDGNWVVGYGHVRVGEPGDAVSRDEAAGLLALDLAEVERVVNEKLTADVAQSQFDALVSFAFSVGFDAFDNSDVLRRTNSGDVVAAACAMDAWRKSDVSGELEIIDALIRRRAAEKALYLKDCAHDAAPSVFMRAKIDHAAAILGAPVKYAAAPAVGSIPVVFPKAETAHLISDVLKSEPATEALLLARVATEAEIVADEEITTAHAKPVARTLEQGRDALNRAAQRAAAEGARKPKLAQGGSAADMVGLASLSLFGVGLVGLGAWTFFGGARDMVDAMAATALIIPGLAALALASVAYSRRPAPSPIRV